MSIHFSHVYFKPILTTPGNVIPWFSKGGFVFLQFKKKYLLINSEGFEVSGSPTSINFYMNNVGRFEIFHKNIKINFPNLAESTIERLNLTMISGEHNRYFSPRCHDHIVD